MSPVCTSVHNTFPVSYDIFPNKIAVNQAVAHAKRLAGTVQNRPFDHGYHFTAFYGTEYRFTAKAETPGVPVPIDWLTASGSGPDPIAPAAAEFQIPRITRERPINEMELRAVITWNTTGRQFGFLGEPRVNVLELNLELDVAHPLRP